MIELRQTLVFNDASKVDAEKIVLGDGCAMILPARYNFKDGGKFFFFFPNLPVPGLYEAEILSTEYGPSERLVKDSLKKSGNVYMVFDSSRNRKYMVLISWKGEKLPTSQDEVITNKYMNGELFEDPE